MYKRKLSLKQLHDCTQNRGDCRSCSLSNYGLDCRNQPIGHESAPRHSRWSRAMAAFTGHHGPVTIKAILDYIPEGLQSRLTGTELGMVMSSVNRAYHSGKAACGCEVEEGAIWIDAIGKLIELDNIRQMEAIK